MVVTALLALAIILVKVTVLPNMLLATKVLPQSDAEHQKRAYKAMAVDTLEDLVRSSAATKLISSMSLPLHGYLLEVCVQDPRDANKAIASRHKNNDAPLDYRDEILPGPFYLGLRIPGVGR